ncbi:MAG: hypothetical protein AAFV07_13710 [Bacteroidota bacterium]
MNNRKPLTAVILFCVFLLPMLIYIFLYTGTETVFNGVPYAYHLSTSGDTVFHRVPAFSVEPVYEETALSASDLKGYISIIGFVSLEDDSMKKTTVLQGNLKRIYDNIIWDADPPFRFVSISWGDSLEALQAYQARQDSDSTKWIYAMADTSTVWNIAWEAFRLEEFRGRGPAVPPFTAQTIALLDKAGRVRKTYVATDLQEERKIQEDLIALLRLEYPEDLPKIRAKR